MKENLILEGNTIYEIDPVCMKMKNQTMPRQAAGGGRITEVEMENCRCKNSCGNGNKKSFVIFGVLILACCQWKRRRECR